MYDLLKKGWHWAKKVVAIIQKVLLIVFAISTVVYLCFKFPHHFLPVVVGIATFFICFYAFVLLSSNLWDWPFTKCKEPRSKLLESFGGKVRGIIYNSTTWVLTDKYESLFVRNRGNINGLPEEDVEKRVQCQDVETNRRQETKKLLQVSIERRVYRQKGLLKTKDGKAIERRNPKNYLVQGKEERRRYPDLFYKGYNKSFPRGFFADFYEFVLSLVGLDDIKWIGLTKKVRKYPIRFGKIEEDKDGNPELVMKTGDEPGGRTPYVFLNYNTFGFEIKNIASKDPEGGPAIDLNLLIEGLLRIKNPFKASVDLEDWYGYLTKKIRAGLMSYIGGHEFGEISLHQKKVKKETYEQLTPEKPFRECLSNIGDFLFREIVDLADLVLVNVDFSDKKDAERLKAPWNAAQKAKAHVIEEKGKADGIDIVRKAEMGYLSEVNKMPDVIPLQMVRIGLEKKQLEKDIEEIYINKMPEVVEKAKPGVILNISRQGNANTNDAIDMASLMELKQLNKNPKKEEKK